MSQHRFNTLLSLVPLTYSIDEHDLDREDPWRNINTFVDAFNEHWAGVYHLPWLLSPDELMSMWTPEEDDGWNDIPFSSYVPRMPKPKVAEFKTVCDGELGCLIRVLAALKYKRKHDPQQVTPPYSEECGLTAAQCLWLCEPWLAQLKQCFWRGRTVHAFISTRGTTRRGKDQRHKDDVEPDGSSAPPRKCPKILNDWTKRQPHTDEHNRWRQSILAIEESDVSTYTGFCYHVKNDTEEVDDDFSEMMEQISVDVMLNTWDEDHSADPRPSSAQKSYPNISGHPLSEASCSAVSHLVLVLECCHPIVPARNKE
ncbi:MAG: hypothetical protein SGPRY_014884 [Prymnesium sp.]